MVGVGLISYSAYLWHWPLFAFARIASPIQSRIVFVFLAVLSLGLAWFSWRFVERPFRNRQLFKRRQIFRFAAVAGCSLAVMGGIGFNGLASRFKAEDADLMVPLVKDAEYVRARYSQLKINTNFSGAGKLKVFLLGDSYSQDFLNMMVEADLFPEAEIQPRYISAACQIYFGKENGLELIPKISRDYCEKQIYNPNFYPSIQPLIQSADIIVLAFSWIEWSARRLPETIENLHIPDSARLIVIGRKSFGPIRRLDYLGLSPQEKAGIKNRVPNNNYQTNEVMRENLKKIPNVEFVDLYRLICGENSYDCPVFSPEGKLLSYDGSHLARSGAQYIGALLKSHPAFNQK
ncbi:MAG: acyltransferase [Azoarcus sp.]|jgi:hypothetical protein|nr:acyltransferase [Azoarcus sp.]